MSNTTSLPAPVKSVELDAVQKAAFHFLLHASTLEKTLEMANLFNRLLAQDGHKILIDTTETNLLALKLDAFSIVEMHTVRQFAA